MFGADLVIRSKLVPPRSGPRRLYRERINWHLGQALDQPLTLVTAGAGYGKSTALADWLSEVPWPVAWYSIAPADQEPLAFLLHLIYAFERIAPTVTKETLAPFAQPGSPAEVRQGVLVRLLNELTVQLDTETLLILDDFHLVLGVPEIRGFIDQLLSYLPPQLHLILSSRRRPDLSSLTVMEARGEVAYLDHHHLSFQADETTRLFRAQYNISLSDRQIFTLHQKSEGWAIALQLIAQRLQAEAANLFNLEAGLEPLFTYLAQDVLSRQSTFAQDFLTQTAILEQLTPDACDYLLNVTNSAAVLAELAARDFFIIRLDADTYRYHHLFADFLRTQLTDEAPLHRRIARYFENHHLSEQAVHHYLYAAAYAEAVKLLIPLAPELVRAGRFTRLSRWLSRLPEESLAQAPALLLAYGDLYRFTNRYQAALECYQQAAQIFRGFNDPLGQSDALQGQARVYLDTVRPAKAGEPLQGALELIELIEQSDLPWKRAEILALLAENEANLGHAAEAQSLQAESTRLLGEPSTPIEVETRLLLRSGRLDEAREKLARQAEHEERGQRAAWAPRQHRETQLLLSFIYAMQGDPERARAAAAEGVTIGRRLGSSVVEAIGYMRLGHAWQIGLDANPDRAETYYHQSIELSERFEVARIKLEPLWGLLRLHGFRGDLASAARYGQEALQLANRAGDGWMGTWTKTMLAASHLVGSKTTAGLEQMRQAQQDFINNGDLFGQAVTLLWQALYEPPDNDQRLKDLLNLAQERGYDCLFASSCMGTPVDPQTTVPLLLKARKAQLTSPYVNRLLDRLGLSDVENHPGFTLRVQTLGAFRVWCGADHIPAQAWQREKARHLFQLLLTRRNHYLQKEQIFEILWPGSSLSMAEKHFKVALNALHHVVEPNRPPRTPPFFVRRRGSSYGLILNDSLSVDCVQFETHIRQGRQAQDRDDLVSTLNHYQQAVDLYQGDFLTQSLYEDWTAEERERLLGLYLRTAERLARLRLQNGQPAAAIALCQAILSRDDCWEAAYRLLMAAYYRNGNRPQALRIFEQCRQVLKETLDVPPMQQTLKLYRRLLYHQSISIQEI